MPARPPLRVMYVEDDRVGALLFDHALRGDPRVTLQVAESLAEALALAARWAPQALLVDAHLPDGLGTELLARLRRLPGLAAVPAYLCSADADAGSVERARAAGFAGFWAKPLPAREVVQALLDTPCPATLPG